ncbi:hypothetical protein HPB48_014499 [Haemaphysalis longicornis]|uniref:Uncharacterized protein n=1 Tax=Haemaphysalis longicornis TaxID=44386 RepID=A0A9J6GV05_HAELO|nr:hypothetical protein HPB48_014499 [Haemaphysalis longicornis]
MQELYELANPAEANADHVARVCRQCHTQFRAYFRGGRFLNLEALEQEARIVQADLLTELRYRLPRRPGESLEPGCAWTGASVPSTHQADAIAVREETTVGNSASLRTLDEYCYEQRRRSGLDDHRSAPQQNCGFRVQGIANSGHRNSSEGNNAGVRRGQQEETARLCWFCRKPGHFSLLCTENMRTT